MNNLIQFFQYSFDIPEIEQENEYSSFDKFRDKIKMQEDFNKTEKTKPVFGIFKGKLKTPDYFNEPLEDFKDYMYESTPKRGIK